jgi:hypothetical protein
MLKTRWEQGKKKKKTPHHLTPKKKTWLVMSECQAFPLAA